MVQRYNQCNWSGGEYSPNDVMQKADDGEYVEYADYEKAINNHEQLVKQKEKLTLELLAIDHYCRVNDIDIEQALKEAEK